MGLWFSLSQFSNSKLRKSMLRNKVTFYVTLGCVQSMGTVAQVTDALKKLLKAKQTAEKLFFERITVIDQQEQIDKVIGPIEEPWIDAS